MEYQYLPALSPGSICDDPTDPRPAHWMDPALPEALQHHSYLASYHLWGGKQLPVWTPQVLKTKPFIFGDSGGFSVVAKDAKIDPRKVILWQIRNCTAGVILDMPPYEFGGKSQFTGSAADLWEERLSRTEGNVARALPLYNDHLAETPKVPFAWYGAVQGETYAQMEEWFDRVSAVYSFRQAHEGWALAPKPCNDILTIVRFMRLAREKKLKRIHVLQTNAPRAVGIIIALAKMAGVEWVTHDSASIHINTANRNAFIDDGRWGGSWGNNVHHGGWDALFQMIRARCTCYVCNCVGIDLLNEVKYEDRHWRNRLLLHNFLNIRAVELRMHAAAEHSATSFLKTMADDKYGAVMREWEGDVTTPAQSFAKVGLLERFGKR